MESIFRAKALEGKYRQWHVRLRDGVRVSKQFTQLLGIQIAQRAHKTGSLSCHHIRWLAELEE